MKVRQIGRNLRKIEKKILNDLRKIMEILLTTIKIGSQN